MAKAAGSDNHHRRSIRLPGYDYAQAGVYFVTLCTQGRECSFGGVVGKEMVLNEAGRIVQEEWERSAGIRKEITLDAFVVMPNHLHGIVTIVDADVEGATGVVGATGRSPLPGLPKHSLGALIAGFKSAATKRINEMRATPGAPVWQRNYYEHIVRNERELGAIREYIRNNPLKWALDENNPARR